MNVVKARRMLLSLMLAGFIGPSVFAADASKPLNILFLFADDQRADTIGAWGNPHIRTPNLDTLVQRGFSFRQNYCLGSNSGAVCVPSRAMLNSGRPYFAIDNQLTGVVTLPQLLRENGYTTFGTGKWHNREPSFLRSFEKGKAIFFGGMSDHENVPLVDLSPDGQLINKRTGQKHSSQLFADAAIEFLTNHTQDKPFYAYVAFTAPHDPRQPPSSYLSMYYEARPPLPANFMPQHPFDNGWMTGRDESLAAWPRTRQVVGDQLAEYYSLITHLDEQIGRILAALDQTGRRDNTLIIYAADHGLAVGSHGLLGKQSVYEHSMKCPLIFIGPGVPQGKTTDAMTYLLDIYPTVCELTGISGPSDLFGQSLRPIWTGEKQKVRGTIFLAFQDLMRSVRGPRWKLIRYPQINHTQLFDLRSDPDELNNLAADPAYADHVERLMKVLANWQNRVGDDQPLTSATPKSMDIDLSGRKREPDRHQPDWIVRKYFGD